MADAIIVSGELTGAETKTEDVDIVRKNTSLPILIGNGATPENLHKGYTKVDGMIVGSYFKTDGKGNNFVEEKRVKGFVEAMESLNAGSRRRIDLGFFIEFSVRKRRLLAAG